MDLSESHLHSFIIKLWLEEATEEADRTAWRGQIKHVPSGEHRHIKSFDEIADFIWPYLKLKGVEAGHGVRLWRWIGRGRLR
ncbi:MAG: hypothetical protein DMF71_10045 [Acidobacteria bacterium]|nr:MAG: hypothetical protein DMF71_10045 [Acidobacteriota bacterium]